jgi:hypothetical protein
MIYSWSTFMDCYSVFSLLQAYFLPTHGNGEVPILGKLPYNQQVPIPNSHLCKIFIPSALESVFLDGS